MPDMRMRLCAIWQPSASALLAAGETEQGRGAARGSRQGRLLRTVQQGPRRRRHRRLAPARGSKRDIRHPAGFGLARTTATYGIDFVLHVPLSTGKGRIDNAGLLLRRPSSKAFANVPSDYSSPHPISSTSLALNSSTEVMIIRRHCWLDVAASVACYWAAVGCRTRRYISRFLSSPSTLLGQYFFLSSAMARLANATRICSAWALAALAGVEF